MKKTISNKADFLYPKHTNIPIRCEKCFRRIYCAKYCTHSIQFNGECDTYLRVCIWVYEHLIFSNVSTRDPFLFVCFLRFRFFFILFFFVCFTLSISLGLGLDLSLSHFHFIRILPTLKQVLFCIYCFYCVLLIVVVICEQWILACWYHPTGW